MSTRNIDEPLAELCSGTTSYYSLDGLGTVTSLTSSAGALANTYVYDSFGNLTASSGPVTNRFRFTGREFDTESGLEYYRARYYDSNAGRFLTEDPVRYKGGLNFYRYAADNPVNFVDPRGLSPVCAWTGSVAVQSWLSSTRQFTTPWTFAFATLDGGPDSDAGVVTANLHCHWTRNYIRQDWETTLYLNTYLCVDHLACGSTIVWLEFDFDTKKKYRGAGDAGTETTTVSTLVRGYESELLDEIYCHGIPP